MSFQHMIEMFAKKQDLSEERTQKLKEKVLNLHKGYCVAVEEGDVERCHELHSELNETLRIAKEEEEDNTRFCRSCGRHLPEQSLNWMEGQCIEGCEFYA
jgi:nucleoid-associated protein YejK